MKTITLVDNGMDYSDHQIYFVESSGESVQVFFDECDFSGAYGNPYILASGRMDVKPDTGTMSFDEFEERYVYSMKDQSRKAVVEKRMFYRHAKDRK